MNLNNQCPTSKRQDDSFKSDSPKTSKLQRPTPPPKNKYTLTQRKGRAWSSSRDWVISRPRGGWGWAGEVARPRDGRVWAGGEVWSLEGWVPNWGGQPRKGGGAMTTVYVTPQGCPGLQARAAKKSGVH